jgi:hypothetical protein
MKIYSSEKYLTVKFPGTVGIVWEKGSTVASVYEGWASRNPREYIHFVSPKKQATMLDFTKAVEDWIWDDTSNDYPEISLQYHAE